MAPLRGTALVRAVSPLLAAGIVTHIERTEVDVALARRQHAAYVDALTGCGWRVRPVPPADDCPDSVFVEDTVVVCGGLAVLTRPGAAQRRPEVAGVEPVVRELGLQVARIEPPGILDGGDVLQVGHTVYVGRGGRTNDEGIRQLTALLAPRGRTVVPVPLTGVLHLKSAVTALPDGTCLVADPAAAALPGIVGAASGRSGAELAVKRPRLKTGIVTVPEPAGAHVVPLGGADVLMAASAPRTAELVEGLGFRPVVVDISEFERLEGCVTCLSVLIG
jgi:dimethylargininase